MLALSLFWHAGKCAAAGCYTGLAAVLSGISCSPMITLEAGMLRRDLMVSFPVLACTCGLLSHFVTGYFSRSSCGTRSTKSILRPGSGVSQIVVVRPLDEACEGPGMQRNRYRPGWSQSSY
ncbi:hypothetical protein Micbo1qcDRAFT_50254 [Microdochium bolleyi]|uniref:Uncharacterized protein n=1 Tax=Microdochium bolleyi TaxID=196109 RepID=A0A136J688_9PEZI|nr:hypothetical protein Micbo1qcDRAFT_50254 [Microdochium bolleyi]